jgi:hypothetical protein
MGSLSTPLFSRAITGAKAEVDKMQVAATEAEKLAAQQKAEADAQTQAQLLGLTNMIQQQPPPAPYVVPQAPTPAFAAMATLGSNIASILGQNQNYRNEAQGELGRQQTAHDAAVKANLEMSNADAARRHQSLLDVQMHKYETALQKAQKMDDIDLQLKISDKIMAARQAKAKLDDLISKGITEEGLNNRAELEARTKLEQERIQASTRGGRCWHASRPA